MEGFKKADNKILVNTTILCEILGVTRRALTDWKRKGLKQHSRGWWDLKHVLKWRGDVSNDGEEATQAVSLQQKKLAAEVAFKEAQSELTRLKTDIANGKFIEKELVEAELSRFFIVFKKSAMSLSRKLAGEVGAYVDPIEARRIEKNLSELVNDALEQMSVDGVYYAKKRKKA